MVRIFIAMFMSSFFMGLVWLITHNWVAASLVAIFFLLFAIFALSLTAAARFGEIDSEREFPMIRQDEARPSLRLAGLKEPKTAPAHK